MTALAVLATTDAHAGRPHKAGSAYVTAYYKPRVAKVVFTGTRFDGVKEPNSGSGFLIGRDLLVTANHVISRFDDYETHTILLELPDQPTPLEAMLLQRDPERDLAVLRLKTPQDLKAPVCPIEGVVPTEDVPPGVELTVLSYPLGLAMGPSRGIFGVFEKGRVRMDAGLDPGASGAPVFLTEQGYFAGIAQGGVRWVEQNGRFFPAQTVNYFLPATALTTGPLAKYIDTESQCWMTGPPPKLEEPPKPPNPFTVVVNTLGSIIAPDKEAKAADASRPVNLTSYVPIDETKPDVSVPPPPLKPEPGYTIVRCTVRVAAAGDDNPGDCDTALNGRSATFKPSPFPVTPGGNAVLVVQQRRTDTLKAVAAASATPQSPVE